MCGCLFACLDACARCHDAACADACSARAYPQSVPSQEVPHGIDVEYDVATMKHALQPSRKPQVGEPAGLERGESLRRRRAPTALAARPESPARGSGGRNARSASKTNK